MGGDEVDKGVPILYGKFKEVVEKLFDFGRYTVSFNHAQSIALFGLIVKQKIVIFEEFLNLPPKFVHRGRT